MKREREGEMKRKKQGRQNSDCESVPATSNSSNSGGMNNIKKIKYTYTTTNFGKLRHVFTISYILIRVCVYLTRSTSFAGITVSIARHIR